MIDSIEFEATLSKVEDLSDLGAPRQGLMLSLNVTKGDVASGSDEVARAS